MHGPSRSLAVPLKFPAVFDPEGEFLGVGTALDGVGGVEFLGDDAFVKFAVEIGVGALEDAVQSEVQSKRAHGGGAEMARRQRLHFVGGREINAVVFDGLVERAGNLNVVDKSGGFEQALAFAESFPRFEGGDVIEDDE